MLNTVIMIGNLTRDIDFRYTTNGIAIAKFALANSRTWNDKATGEKKEETCFIDCTVIGRSAEVINQYCKKGSKVRISGRIQLERWTDQNGQNRSKHSIMVEDFEFLNTRDSGGDYTTAPAMENDPFGDTPQTVRQPVSKPVSSQAPAKDPFDFDDIPF